MLYILVKNGEEMKYLRRKLSVKSIVCGGCVKESEESHGKFMKPEVLSFHLYLCVCVFAKTLC